MAGTAFKVAANETIFPEGQRGEKIYLLKHGSVLICNISKEGREIGYSIIRPGELFGLAALARDPTPENLSAIAITECELIGIDKATVLAALQQDPELVSFIISTLVRRLQERTQQLADLALVGLSGRLAKWLLRLVQEAGIAKSGETMRIEHSQKLIGSLLGVGREAINRKLQQWNDEKIIALDAKYIRVLNLKKLENLCEDFNKDDPEKPK